MRKLCYFSERLKDNKGVTAVVVAISLVVLIGFAAMAIDVGYLLTSRNELQNIADGAALAGARTLGRIYECNGDLTATDIQCSNPMPYPQQLTYVADFAVIKQAITNVASRSQAGGKTNITINDSDIVIGNWDATAKTVNPITLTSPDAVRVTVRRDASANSPISTFFANILGISIMNVSAVATAALTGSYSMGPGGLPIPVAINKSWMSSVPCDQDLTFHPSSAGTCAAWHAYLPGKVKDGADPYNANGDDMSQLLIDIATLTYSSPETIAGETEYDFTNGDISKLFNVNQKFKGTSNEGKSSMQYLFDEMKVKNDGKYDFDTDNATWTTSVPIFEDDTAGCSPNGSITIVGFATIVITGVDPPPVSTIYARVKCDIVEPGRGGGGYYGTKGTIPNLVQ